ncbi:hypothetical protein SB861_47035 [Paraburkholderia sp. SIMBA_049]
MTDKIKYLEDLNAELAQALGEAIWAFAMIERLTYSYLRKLSSEPLDELMGDQQFRPRIKLIRHLVKRLKGQDEDKAVALRYLDRAEELAATRNLLAHNPWQTWIDFDESRFKSEIRKTTDEKKTIDLEKVRAFREDAGEVASTLEYLLGELHYPGP